MLCRREVHRVRDHSEQAANLETDFAASLQEEPDRYSTVEMTPLRTRLRSPLRPDNQNEEPQRPFERDTEPTGPRDHKNSAAPTRTIRQATCGRQVFPLGAAP